jgi:hypothetical protein
MAVAIARVSETATRNRCSNVVLVNRPRNRFHSAIGPIPWYGIDRFIFSFKNSGIQVTFSDPLKSTLPAVSRSTSASATYPSGPLGTCLGGQRPASVAVCGNDPDGPTPELNKITLTFNQAVKLLSAAGVTRSIVGDTMGDNIISSIWTTPGSSASFIATNSDNTMNPGDVTLDPFDFMFSNFIAQANIPVTVETSFTQGKLDYWVQNLKVEAVPAPGPLPLLGVGTAFACSRRIRRRCKVSRRIEMV